jgi:hypothetical protein
LIWDRPRSFASPVAAVIEAPLCGLPTAPTTHDEQSYCRLVVGFGVAFQVAIEPCQATGEDVAAIGIQERYTSVARLSPSRIRTRTSLSRTAPKGGAASFAFRACAAPKTVNEARSCEKRRRVSKGSGNSEIKAAGLLNRSTLFTISSVARTREVYGEISAFRVSQLFSLEHRRRAAASRRHTGLCADRECWRRGCRRAKRYLRNRSPTRLQQER